MSPSALRWSRSSKAHIVVGPCYEEIAIGYYRTKALKSSL
jgi:hypothetical protein